MAKIITKSGDGGMTFILSGKHVLKSDPIIEICGSLDELSAHVGLLSTIAQNSFNVGYLEDIQHILLDVGTFYTTDLQKECDLSIDLIDEIELLINNMEEQIAPIDSFIFFNRDMVSSYVNLCRTVCRRTERAMVRVDTYSNCLKYINRLSDYFFILACILMNYNFQDK